MALRIEFVKFGGSLDCVGGKTSRLNSAELLAAIVEMAHVQQSNVYTII